MTGPKRLSLAVSASVLLSVIVAIAPATPVSASSTWLDRLNAWRASVNLPALTENTTWDQGDYNHSLYMVKDDLVTHYEVSTEPYYTVAGDAAARNGNIEVNSTTWFSDSQAIDWWMGAPFHALGMMDPRLTSTGFGSYREVKAGWDAGFTLDTLRGNSFTGGAYPVFFPGGGSIVPLTSYSGNEFPDPLQACPGYAMPTGLPAFVEVGGNVATTVAAHSFTGNGVALANCVIDSHNAAVGSYLTQRGAVILIPQAPLHAGVTYGVSLTVNGALYSWSFGVSGDGTITAPLACPVSVTLAATESTTQFSASAASSGCSVNRIDFELFDSTLNQGWSGVGSVSTSTSSASVTIDGFAGHTYQVRARGLSNGNLLSAWTAASTAVSATATLSHPWNGLYVMDDYGGLHPADSPPVAFTAYWSGWKIARAAHAQPGSPDSGLVLDGYGGLHYYGAPEAVGSGAAYWSGWDIARDFAFLPDGTGGYVLDGWGGLHPFGVNGHAPPPAINGEAYWPGWDIARKVVIFSDGTGGYVMDGYGGLHPFGIGGPAPAGASGGPYWGGWQIARDVVLIPGSHAGYVLDGYGGIHPFNGAPGIAAPGYWSGWDIARGLWLEPGSTLSAPAGYVLDGWGGLHPFGGAPAIKSAAYWLHWDIAGRMAGG